jgi:hypothetical protein
MREALRHALEFDVEIESTDTPEKREFDAIMKRDGAKAALAWRSSACRSTYPRETDMTKSDDDVRRSFASTCRSIPIPRSSSCWSRTCSASCAASVSSPDEFAKPFKGGVNFCGATVLLDAKGATFERIVNGGRDGDTGRDLDGRARIARAGAVGAGANRAGAARVGRRGRRAFLCRSAPGPAARVPAAP